MWVQEDSTVDRSGGLEFLALSLHAPFIERCPIRLKMTALHRYIVHTLVLSAWLVPCWLDEDCWELELSRHHRRSSKLGQFMERNAAQGSRLRDSHSWEIHTAWKDLCHTNWCGVQRIARRFGRYPYERVDTLDRLGFCGPGWTVMAASSCTRERERFRQKDAG